MNLVLTDNVGSQNYTGATFGEDEEYDYNEFLVSPGASSRDLPYPTFTDCIATYHSRLSPRSASLPWKSCLSPTGHSLPTRKRPGFTRKSSSREARSNS